MLLASGHDTSKQKRLPAVEKGTHIVRDDLFTTQKREKEYILARTTQLCALVSTDLCRSISDAESKKKSDQATGRRVVLRLMAFSMRRLKAPIGQVRGREKIPEKKGSQLGGEEGDSKNYSIPLSSEQERETRNCLLQRSASQRCFTNKN